MLPTYSLYCSLSRSSRIPISSRWNQSRSLVLQNALVIIDDFHFITMAFTPNKTDAPLIVDPNRMLPFPIASQCFQLISRRRRQDVQFCGCVQLEQLP
jgi:hypothetical protein